MQERHQPCRSSRALSLAVPPGSSEPRAEHRAGRAGSVQAGKGTQGRAAGLPAAARPHGERLEPSSSQSCTAIEQGLKAPSWNKEDL